jgi:hypothetical protein
MSKSVKTGEYILCGNREYKVLAVGKGRTYLLYTVMGKREDSKMYVVTCKPKLNHVGDFEFVGYTEYLTEIEKARELFNKIVLKKVLQ